MNLLCEPRYCWTDFVPDRVLPVLLTSNNKLTCMSPQTGLHMAMSHLLLAAVLCVKLGWLPLFLHVLCAVSKMIPDHQICKQTSLSIISVTQQQCAALPYYYYYYVIELNIIK